MVVAAQLDIDHYHPACLLDIHWLIPDRDTFVRDTITSVVSGLC